MITTARRVPWCSASRSCTRLQPALPTRLYLRCLPWLSQRPPTGHRVLGFTGKGQHMESSLTGIKHSHVHSSPVQWTWGKAQDAPRYTRHKAAGSILGFPAKAARVQRRKRPGKGWEEWELGRMPGAGQPAGGGFFPGKTQKEAAESERGTHQSCRGKSQCL